MNPSLIQKTSTPNSYCLIKLPEEPTCGFRVSTHFSNILDLFLTIHLEYFISWTFDKIEVPSLRTVCSILPLLPLTRTYSRCFSEQTYISFVISSVFPIHGNDSNPICWMRNSRRKQTERISGTQHLLTGNSHKVQRVQRLFV